MSIEERAGEILRENRQMCGMSAERLSDAVMEKFGADISGGTIRRYERGERTYPLVDAILLAAAMDINTQNLIEGLDPRNASALPTRQIGKLSPVVHDVLVDIATKWRGNVDALMIACAVYTKLPPKYAHAAIMGLVEQAHMAMADGALKQDDLPQGLSILQQEIGKLSEIK